MIMAFLLAFFHALVWSRQGFSLGYNSFHCRRMMGLLFVIRKQADMK